MYKTNNLNFCAISEHAKSLLSLYRQVAWSIDNRANFMVEESQVEYGMDSESAYLYLSTFAPDKLKEDFETRVANLLESKLMIRIIFEACERLREYPEYGEYYYQIIYHYYLSKTKISDQICMSKVCLERTAYYQRKKEAVALMGVIIWGYSLPGIISELEKGQSIDKVIPAQ